MVEIELITYSKRMISSRLRVVALGDSLTAGLQTRSDLLYPSRWTPYTEFLEELARVHLAGTSSDLVVEVINKGVCGDLTVDMLERFGKDVVEQQPAYVIILGGTNDVGWNLDSSIIVRNLKAMYDLAKSNRIEPVACAVPSILGFDDLIPARLHLNDLVQDEAERREIQFIDLFSATAEADTNRLLERYSGDGIHLNAEGYQMLSQVIFQQWLRPAIDGLALSR